MCNIVQYFNQILCISNKSFAVCKICSLTIYSVYYWIWPFIDVDEKSQLFSSQRGNNYPIIQFPRRKTIYKRILVINTYIIINDCNIHEEK